MRCLAEVFVQYRTRTLRTRVQLCTRPNPCDEKQLPSSPPPIFRARARARARARQLKPLPALIKQLLQNIPNDPEPEWARMLDRVLLRVPIAVARSVIEIDNVDRMDPGFLQRQVI